MAEIDFETMDEEVAAQVKAALAEKDQQIATATARDERRTVIHGSEDVAKQYPRAINALRNKAIAEPELAGEELTAWLAAKEGEYVALGVPEPGATQEPAEQTPESAPAAQPAEGWGGSVGSGAPPAPNLSANLEGDLNSLPTSIDARIVEQLDQLNSSPGGRRSIREITSKRSNNRPIPVD